MSKEYVNFPDKKFKDNIKVGDFVSEKDLVDKDTKDYMKAMEKEFSKEENKHYGYTSVGNNLIYKKIPVIMAAVGAIGKNKKNTMQNYAFRGIDDIYNAFNPELSKNGVFCAPEILEYSREERAAKSGGALIYTVVKMKFRFYAEDGSFIDVVTIGEAMDSGDKSANKAMSAAQKYAFIELFCIPTEENIDTENETHEVEPKKVEKPGMELMDTLDEWIQSAADAEKRTVEDITKSLKGKYDLDDASVVKQVIKLLETKYGK